MILHIDMDAFFASIEQRDHPELQGKPVIISRDSARSVVSTASYEARQFGIHSAMPVFQAKQKYNNLIIVPGNMKKYKETSKKIMEVLTEFSPLVEPISIDEAYLDITGCEKLFGTSEQIGIAVKKRIYDQTKLTASVGIAPLKFLSKIASDMDKPDGLTIIHKSKAKNFIENLPIQKVPGIGKTSLKTMKLLQIEKLGQIKKFPEHVLKKKFGVMGARLLELSNGCDTSSVIPRSERKSISSETTLNSDIHDYEAVKKIILDRSQVVGRQLRKKAMVSQTVFIKLKFTDFSQLTRQIKLSQPICSSSDIFNAAVSLYRKIKLSKKIRLVGVGVSALSDRDKPVQMELLFHEKSNKKQWEAVDKAVDTIAEKFGSFSVHKASLNKKNRRPPDDR